MGWRENAVRIALGTCLFLGGCKGTTSIGETEKTQNANRGRGTLTLTPTVISTAENFVPRICSPERKSWASTACVNGHEYDIEPTSNNGSIMVVGSDREAVYRLQKPWEIGVLWYSAHSGLPFAGEIRRAYENGSLVRFGTSTYRFSELKTFSSEIKQGMFEEIYPVGDNGQVDFSNGYTNEELAKLLVADIGLDQAFFQTCTEDGFGIYKMEKVR